ncbi:MAG: pirin family protein [Candidatus Marinimicrobia bacterium]|nr:pirin family protein [Candidatus Neomarinimicrobiota bacterium]MBL7030248.1 pirin family protein [Candidatus Neomarinimicrobiota bacterium]
MDKIRSIQKVIKGTLTTDGAGVNLTRIIGGPELNMLDPFLLLDEFGSDNPNDYIAGFPPHPHRGFETITYMLNGKWQHKDSAGHEGLLGEGSVQWMTAGRGIIHSEMPIQTDGLARGFQLWLNLPKEKKMIDPAYADIPSEAIPIVNVAGGTVKVISGTFEGITGPGKPHTGMLYYDVRLKNNVELDLPIPDGWNTFLYIYEGSIFLDEVYSKGQLLTFSQNGNLSFKSSSNGVRIILVAGEPLNEPVARGGPFVMNTRGEVLKAFEDFQNGKFES